MIPTDNQKPGFARRKWETDQNLTTGLILCSIAFWLIAGTLRGADSTNAHWSFKALAPSDPRRFPQGDSGQFIDAIIKRHLVREGLTPTPRADKLTLLRRATFDLTGLPPTPEEIARFESDHSPEAFMRTVDRLLASPQYGERWGRHWMDVARYADTAGDNADYPVPEAHLYRDYIIDAFNADMPYDQFVQEQLAGDLMISGEADPRRASKIIATGFLALSRRYGTGPFELWHLTLENTLETVGQAFMGLNLKCARCHDHKFDPLTMRDYYGLYGIFASAEYPWAGSEEVQSKQFNRQKFVPLAGSVETSQRMASWTNRIQKLKESLAEIEKARPAKKPELDAWEKQVAGLKKEIRTLEKPGTPADLPVAYAVREGRVADVPLQKRGDPATPGELIRRCLPEAFAGSTPFNPAPERSGRLEFAKWLTSPRHPLTARVMANRIWQYHFGRGLAPTPNNLGMLSEPPVMPELLDELAVQFIQQGWSIKALHRMILSSDAYQRSSQDLVDSRAKDPSNRFQWRYERRRLEAEPIRDAMLMVSGSLDSSRPGAHPFPGPEGWTWTQHTPFKERYENRNRSVYLMTQRFQKHPFIALFDGPDTNLSTESRKSSTIPQQALFAMNNSFVEEQSSRLARRVMHATSENSQRLKLLHELAWGRHPDPAEEHRAMVWLKKVEATCTSTGTSQAVAEEESWTVLCRVMLTANEFFHVD